MTARSAPGITMLKPPAETSEYLQLRFCQRRNGPDGQNENQSEVLNTNVDGLNADGRKTTVLPYKCNSWDLNNLQDTL